MAKMLGYRMTVESLRKGETEGTLVIVNGKPEVDPVVEIRFTASGRMVQVLISRTV